MRVLERVLQAVGVLTGQLQVEVGGGAPPPPATDLSRVDVTRRVFDNDGARAERAVAALALHDEETLGYLLLTMQRKGPGAQIGLSVQLTDEMWPGIMRTMTDIKAEAVRQQDAA